MKGITESIFGYLVIVLVVLALIFFLVSQGGIRGAEVGKSVSVRVFDETATLAISSLFNEKVDFVEKPYAEVLVDAILTFNESENITEKYKAFYGAGVGELNNTEIISPLFENYMPAKWKLEIITPNGTLTYGNLSKEAKYVYEQIIPVPEERIGRIILYMG